MPRRKNTDKKTAGKPKGTKGISNSLRAGLTFPVGRIGSMLRKNKNLRVSRDAPVFLAAILEYLTAEIIELAGNICQSKKKKLIQPRHIVLALQDDDELKTLLKDCQFHSGGLIPAGIHPALMKLRKDYKKGTQFTSHAIEAE